MWKKSLSTLALLILAWTAHGAAGRAELWLKPVCDCCGADRSAQRSRMTVTFADGGSLALCGIHCLVEGLEQKAGLRPEKFRVADSVTRRLIDARSAFWVTLDAGEGCDGRPLRVAFARIEDAQALARSQGVKVSNFSWEVRRAWEESL